MFAALLIGNCAYEGGNLSGGALGLDALMKDQSPGQSWLVAGLALIAAAAVLVGRYALLEKLLIALVMVMSAAFVVSVFLVGIDWGEWLNGLVPRIPDGGTLMAVALIGHNDCTVQSVPSCGRGQAKMVGRRRPQTGPHRLCALHWSRRAHFYSHHVDRGERSVPVRTGD